ncbi:MAG TPA: zeta toxin family protein [Cyclobacteriaceae bacterium]|jgi:predicted ABC-type ATPase|nr:zeta toxin family protein [Cyclobacteriaceae bacterium]
MPNLYVIAGCNGAGKTTTSYTVLPEMLNCREFVNADEIARGLSPFQPETVSFQAGRIMLDRIKELIAHQKDFGFETTLATKSYVPLLTNAKRKGYSILLIYFWLESIDLAKSRVLDRVKKGGHNIKPEVIERRYKRGLANFFSLYKDQVDTWVVYDNSKSIPSLIAKGGKGQEFLIHNSDIWKSLESK